MFGKHRHGRKDSEPHSEQHGKCHPDLPAGHPEMHCHQHGTMLSRFLWPCLLMLLAEGESHGYDLMEKLPEVGYLDSIPDPATVYKVLRKLEAHDMVKSEWDTSGAGPAKRVYTITPEGEEMIRGWAVSLRKTKESVEKFLKVFQNKFGK
ncbi:MAG: PadR family transcriptional regulator [Planctomycetota bacterium]|nr:MAG: PadR family transcriptional regulator [Planctomycetota bacterium]